MAENPDETLPRGLLFFLQRQTHVSQQEQGVRDSVLPEYRLAQQPPRGLGSERVDRLVRRREQSIKTQFGGGVAETSRVGAAQQLRSRGVDQLQDVFAVKGKQRCDHDLENA